MAGQAPRRLLFPRGARIKQGRDFRRVRQGGERLICGCLVANWHHRLVPRRTGSFARPAATRLGVITSGRIGGAVVRNRARRLLREAFRLHQHELARPVDLVLVARPSIAGKTFAAVERDFLTALQKGKIVKVKDGTIRVNAVQHILIFAVRLYRWVISPAKTAAVRAIGALPFHAELFRVRHRRAAGAWGVAGKRAGAAPGVPLPSLGRVRR